MLALLIWCGPCISYAAPSRLLLQFYASLAPLWKHVVHFCLVHTSSYVVSMSHLSNVYVSSMPHPCIIEVYQLCILRLCINSALPLHLLCIFYASSMYHVGAICASCRYVTIIYLPSMCHLRTSSALPMYHLRTISASSIHRLCVIYAPDYTIYVPSMHHLSIINASTSCRCTHFVSSLHFQCIIYVSSVNHRCIT